MVEVAKFDHSKIEELMLDTAIIRNRLKIEAAVHNAKLFIQIQQEHGSFDNIFGALRIIRSSIIAGLASTKFPATSELSDRKGFKARGFKFVGSTTITLIYRR